MRQVLRRGLPAAVIGLLLAGCTSTVVGTASPGAGEPTDVSATDFPITGVSDDPIDQFARNALTDLNTFWQEQYPQAFGEDFQPLQGGYFSVDSTAVDQGAYPDTGIGCQGSPTMPDAVAGNAFYDPNCDLIAYDRALLKELSADYGRFLGPVVMAHEFGHAMQGRFGFADSGRSIQDETQADCFAGAWTRWVADGNAQHVALRVPELDDVVRGFLLLRDAVGSDPEDTQAHGSYFDRVSAYYEGYDGGVTACRDDFGSDRLFTAASFDDEMDFENEGDAPYETLLQIVDTTLPGFWGQVFGALGRDFTDPTITPFDGTAPQCGDMGAEDRDLGFCDSDDTVYYDQQDLAQPAYNDIGDFAVATAISLPYALAARSELGLSVNDGAATRSAVCLSGAYTANVFNGAFADDANGGITLSPGDVDEGVIFLLKYGVDDHVFPNVDSSGFELVGLYRGGFLQGARACEIAG
jgi:predicted metalloprotease